MQAAARVLAILNSRCISLPAGKMLFCGGKSAFFQRLRSRSDQSFMFDFC
jgi:hypothetical protein